MTPPPKHRWNLAHAIVEHGIIHPNAPAYLVPKLPERTHWVPITWSQHAQFVLGLVSNWSRLFGKYLNTNPVVSPSSSPVAAITPSAPPAPPPVAAIVISPIEDAFAPFCALSSIGFTVISINPFFPPEALAKICDRANVSLIVTGGRPTDCVTRAKALRPKIQLHVLDYNTESLAVHVNNLHNGRIYHHLHNHNHHAHPINNSYSPYQTSPNDQQQQFRHSTHRRYPSQDDLRSRVVDLIQARETTARLPVVEPAVLMLSSGTTSIPKIIPWKSLHIILHKKLYSLVYLNSQSLLVVYENCRRDTPSSPHIPIFLNRELYALFPLKMFLEQILYNRGWTAVTPLYDSFNASDLLENWFRANICVSRCLIYVSDVVNIIKYLSESSGYTNGNNINDIENARKREYLEFLRSQGPLICGGAPMDKCAMAMAIRLGIRIKLVLGISECGIVMSSDPEVIENEWGTVKNPEPRLIEKAMALAPLPGRNIYFEQAESIFANGFQLYELVMYVQNDPGFSCPSVANSTSTSNDGTLARKWRSGDLFRKVSVRVEGQEDMYLYESRRDDMINIGSAGTKILPSAVESMIYEHFAASGYDDVELLLVGASRPYPSLFVKQHQALSAFRRGGDHLNMINTIVVDMCIQISRTLLPNYYPLKPEMVYFLQDGEDFVRTIKGVPHRAKTELVYAHQLETLYSVY